MKYIKITHGYVTQEFCENGQLIRQWFTAGDDVEYETEDGKPMTSGNEYFPFTMVQP